MLPKAVTDAMAVYENAWHDFLRRGFHLQIRPYRDNPGCMTPGVADNVLRAGIRQAAKERGIPFIAGWGPNPDSPAPFGTDWQTDAVGYELVIPKRGKVEAILAMARLSHPGDTAEQHMQYGVWRRERATVLEIGTDCYAYKGPHIAAEQRWAAITNALATNNTIRAQMGLPLFTGGVTEPARCAA